MNLLILERYFMISFSSVFNYFSNQDLILSPFYYNKILYQSKLKKFFCNEK